MRTAIVLAADFFLIGKDGAIIDHSGSHLPATTPGFVALDNNAGPEPGDARTIQAAGS